MQEPDTITDRAEKEGSKEGKGKREEKARLKGGIGLESRSYVDHREQIMPQSIVYSDNQVLGADAAWICLGQHTYC